MRRIGLGTLCLLCGCAATTLSGSGVNSSSPFTRDTATTSPQPSVEGRATAGTAVAVPASSATVPTTQPKPSPTPTYTGSRTLVESDSGATIKLKVGEIVKVSLPAEYDPPNAQGNELTRVSSTGGYPSGQRLEAVFRADKSGRTDITSSTDYACLHTTPMCEIAQRLWIVHVVVA